MGAASQRVRLTRALNQAFSAANIEASADRARALPARADFLDISDALGVMSASAHANLRRYRRTLSLPTVVQRVLTAAYKESLLNKPKPIPLRIQINRAPRHSVSVEHSDKLIKVVLNRPDVAD
jgi:hypothetical protein